MSHRLPFHIVDILEDAARCASLERASFDFADPVKEVILRRPGEEDEIVFTGTVTDFIRERVKLHHDTWIIGPIRQTLAWSETTDDGSQNEHDILGRLRAKLPNPKLLEEAYQEIVKLREENDELTLFKQRVQDAVDTIQKALA